MREDFPEQTEKSWVDPSKIINITDLWILWDY